MLFENNGFCHGVPPLFIMPERGIGFAVTVNNWSQEQYDTLHVFITLKCKCGIIGKEVGENETPHLQAAFVTKERWYFTALITELGVGFHVEAMKKGWDANKKYCSKEDKNAFLLDPPVVTRKQGAREDLSAAKTLIRAAANWRAVMDNDELAPVVAKYPKWAADIWATRPFKTMVAPILRQWQHDIIEELKGPVHPRKIIWFYDFDGYHGKSWLNRYLMCNFGGIEMPNKSQDVYYLYQGQPIVMWDLARTAQERVPYEAIEKVKDGKVINTKYVPENKIFDPPHVLIFANYEPNEQAWSKDRYDIRTEFDCSEIVIVIAE